MTYENQDWLYSDQEAFTRRYSSADYFLISAIQRDDRLKALEKTPSVVLNFRNQIDLPETSYDSDSDSPSDSGLSPLQNVSPAQARFNQLATSAHIAQFGVSTTHLYDPHTLAKARKTMETDQAVADLESAENRAAPSATTVHTSLDSYLIE